MAQDKTGPHGTPRSGLDTGRKALETASGRERSADSAQDDLVDVGSEESFPASDPPSYMGGTAVSGAPSHDGTVREGVSRTLVDPCEAKPAGDAPQGTDPARVGKAPPRPGYGGSQ
ncbi:hypothetical protein [Microvirga subterranea]|uniref:Uncharacterized protein n=1 Tax=Microvirga subterranea TaxID=186651 RepID=A0A370HR15_9HYPH|nr:hypothetical protein [Microvirga subterranea]RDI60977.1 hypothetical protein DES45_102367 [Microvirga subterranea]